MPWVTGEIPTNSKGIAMGWIRFFLEGTAHRQGHRPGPAMVSFIIALVSLVLALISGRWEVDRELYTWNYVLWPKKCPKWPWSVCLLALPRTIFGDLGGLGAPLGVLRKGMDKFLPQGDGSQAGPHETATQNDVTIQTAPPVDGRGPGTRPRHRLMQPRWWGGGGTQR